MVLTSKQRAHLKALAHEKKPVVLLGHKGLTDAVIKETHAALLAHELIKVRLTGEDAEALDAEAADLERRSGAELIARLGKVATLYKRHPDEPRIELPRR
ncbi:MAG: ribosome assembly RNA-binding protein YhbY [Deltaproteobacteria bacterium]|nr:ribosome assembly RNA-binding protein YhbY [Deltaproteobacteria bacterium]